MIDCNYFMLAEQARVRFVRDTVMRVEAGNGVHLGVTVIIRCRMAVILTRVHCVVRNTDVIDTASVEVPDVPVIRLT